MKGAIAAGHALTARAGARILEEGGNAVDACVAAGFAGWVAESPLTGPGAGGFALVAPRGRRAAGRRLLRRHAGPRAPGAEGRRDARDRRRLRRRQRDDPDLPHRRRVVRRAGDDRRPRGGAPGVRPPAVGRGGGAGDRARPRGRRADAPAGAPARDPRPDPPSHRRGAPPLQPAGRLAAAAGRRPAPPGPRGHARADRRGGRGRALPGRARRGGRAHGRRGRRPPHGRRPGRVRGDLARAGARAVPRLRGDLEPTAVVGRDPDRLRARAPRAHRRGGPRVGRRDPARSPW